MVLIIRWAALIQGTLGAASEVKIALLDAEGITSNFGGESGLRVVLIAPSCRRQDDGYSVQEFLYDAEAAQSKLDQKLMPSNECHHDLHWRLRAGEMVPVAG